jgi:hypothetical protein
VTKTVALLKYANFVPILKASLPEISLKLVNEVSTLPEDRELAFLLRELFIAKPIFIF